MWTDRNCCGADDDNMVANFAGLFAIGLALFPTAPDTPTPTEELISYVHYFCAISLFYCLSYIPLCLFTKTVPGQDLSNRPYKRHRNVIFKIGGSIILACLALAALINVPPFSDWLGGDKPTFLILQCVMVFTFGLTWIVKGQQLRRIWARGR